MSVHVRTDVVKPAEHELAALTPPLTPPKNLATPLPPPATDLPESYVEHVMRTTKARPPFRWSNILKELNWINVAILTVTPALTVYGLFSTKLLWKTFLFAVFYYYVTGLGITAGYHRLWSHRSYNASKPLEWALALAGAGAGEGSIRWWSRGHRAHHRYTDTELDPYSAHKGLLWSHIGWMVVLPRRKPGYSDTSDLNNNPIVAWQHRHYLPLFIIMAFIVPTVIPGLLWGDWSGGYFYAGAARLMFVHHSTFCVNSLAHWLGDTPFDDKKTPRDHIFTALVTIGEGYHNFHHEFPSDFRNAIKWYQYDPTKWFIAFCSLLGLASHLKTFPDNEIKKGQLTMQLKKLHEKQQGLDWPVASQELPVVSWDAFQEQSLSRPLVAVSGFIHDVSSFLDEHPGGRHLLAKHVGKDATAPFFGGVYDHSNAAHNLLAMMRVGVLHGGLEVESEKATPPSQKLRVVRAEELRLAAAAAAAAAKSNEDDDDLDGANMLGLGAGRSVTGA